MLILVLEHDSLKISNGKWMWWSRGFGGNSALDYLIKVKGMSFMDAMKILTKEDSDLHHSDKKICRKTDHDAERKLMLPEKSELASKVMWYLAGRGIDIDIVKDCIDEGLLYESLPYHNCVFVGFDENGKAAYAFIRSSNDGERLMGEAAGSDKRYYMILPSLLSAVLSATIKGLLKDISLILTFYRFCFYDAIISSLYCKCHIIIPEERSPSIGRQPISSCICW